jgi:hypothetical protein
VKPYQRVSQSNQVKGRTTSRADRAIVDGPERREPEMDNNAHIILVMIFIIPIVAIIGGIASGITKTRGRQRLIELAQRERIAAIEKGLDPAKLPPLPSFGDDMTAVYLTPRQAELRRAQSLLTGGLVLLAVGLGLAVTLLFLPDPEANKAWAAGCIPGFIGIALLVSSSVVRKGAPADDAPAPRA